MSETPVPEAVARMVDEYVDHELSDRVKYVNREPLDESGVYSLHILASRIYAEGWGHGSTVADARARARRQRERDADVDTEQVSR